MQDSFTNATSSKGDLEAAQEACAQEPIHIPGSIQPHGYAIIIDDQKTIVKVSGNIAELLNSPVSEVLNRPLDDFIDKTSLEDLLALTSEGALNPLKYMPLSIGDAEHSHAFDAIIHRSGPFRIIEFERSSEQSTHLDQQDFYREVISFSAQSHKITDLPTLYNFVVSEIRRVSGFARVKLYQFDEEWNGTVVAEAKDKGMESYLGLSFPASDIPRQARKLYSRNYLRLISDVAYEPSPILPDDLHSDGKSVDLSFSVLRSVSPIHIQYLKNMGVFASMSISVLQNGRLWGLIACHHDKPIRLSYPVRMLSEMIGHSFSALLSNFQHHSEAEAHSNRERIVKELGASLAPSRGLINALKPRYELMLGALDADGVIVHIAGKSLAFGVIPETSQVKDIVTWLKNEHEDSAFATNAVGSIVDLVVKEQPSAAGVLAVPLSPKMTDYAIWFRQEQMDHKAWAGKPEKQVSKTETGFHLPPRASFARWQEEVRGKSRPWTNDNIQLASQIGKLLIANHYQDELRQQNENLDSILNNSSAMIYIIAPNHRLISLNNAAQTAFAFQDESFVGETVEAVFDENFAGVLLENQREVLQRKQSIDFSYEIELNGQLHHYIGSHFPLYAANGEIYATCCMSTDISEIKEQAELLRASNVELERMAYIASHDLQEPLRMMSSFTDVLSTKYEDMWDEEDQEYIGFIKDGAKRMKNLIADLLYYSSISNDKREIHSLDAQKECESLLHYLGTLYSGQDVSIIQKNKFPVLHMHSEHFNCLLQNLISNAIKYAKNDVAPEVVIDIGSDENHWIISVCDNGIGIKEEFHDRIFEVFQRLHRDETIEGTGIGLALVQRIVGDYNGKVWIESKFGEGSTFYFSVPKSPQIAKGFQGRA